MTALTLDRIRTEIQRVEAQVRAGQFDGDGRATLDRLYMQESIRMHKLERRIAAYRTKIAAAERELNA